MKAFTFSPLSSPISVGIPSPSQKIASPASDAPAISSPSPSPSPSIASKHSAFTKIQPRALQLDVPTSYETETHITPQYTPEIKTAFHHRTLSAGHVRSHSTGFSSSKLASMATSITSPITIAAALQQTDLPSSPANLPYLMGSPSMGFSKLSLASPPSPSHSITSSPSPLSRVTVAPTSPSYGAAPKQRIRSKHTSDSLLGKDLSSPTRHRRSRSTTDDVKLVAARQFIQAAILCCGAHTDTIPTQKQIQRAGMDTRWQQVGRNYLRDLHIVSVDTKTRLTPEYATLAQVDMYLSELQRAHEEDGVPVPPSSQTLAAIAAGIPVKSTIKKSNKTQSEMMAHRPVELPQSLHNEKEVDATAVALLASVATTNPSSPYTMHRSSVPLAILSPTIPRHQRSATYDALPLPIPLTSPFLQNMTLPFPLPLAVPVTLTQETTKQEQEQDDDGELHVDEQADGDGGAAMSDQA